MTRPTAPADRSGSTSRGQTVQDFAVGISVFLLAVGFVFAVAPTVVTPYEVDVGAGETAQADRIATAVVGNLSVPGEPNRLESGWNSTVDGWGPDDLRAVSGLPSRTGVNVTVENVSSSEAVESAGETPPENRPTAVSTAIVRTQDDKCDPACRVVARVW